MRTDHQSGFTIAELLVTVTIFTIGALGTMALQRAASRMNTDARRLDRAKNVSDQVLESIRGMPMSTLAPKVPVTAALADKVQDGVTFHRRYTVSSLPANAALRQIVVQVSYADHGNESDLHFVENVLIRTQMENP